MRELVAKDRASLTEKDTRGYTPLALVASKSIEEKDIAEWLVTEGGIDMLDMEIEAAEGPGKGDIPVLLAAANGHKEITRYLFFKANWVWYSLFNNNCFYADKLLRHCIHAEIFDVAAALLKYNPLLRHTFDTQLSLCYMKPIYELACKPTVFPSGTRLNPFQHIIYKVLLVPMQMEIEGKRESNTNLAAKICKFMRSLAGAITGFLIKLPGIKKIYETKINHYLVNEILKSFCERIKKIPSQSKLHQLSVQDAMLQAAKNGIVEFIRSMGKANPDLLRVVDTNKRGIMAHAILNRQKEVFNLIYEIQDRTELITPIDVIGNNLLHLAADLGLSPSHDHGSNAALEMQKEHQWFKEVESNVPPMYKEAKNSYDIKPGELFTTSHKQLVKDGCEWAKGRPAPFIVIGTFIMTFSIGTAFRMHEEPFSYVMVAIALSFITSLTSVLAFTSIITSSYAEKDFIKSLPITFFFGVVNNFLSLVFLVWAFGAILSVELKEHVWMAIAGITYVFIGVVMFMCSLWPYVNSICLLLPRCLRRVLYVAN